MDEQSPETVGSEFDPAAYRPVKQPDVLVFDRGEAEPEQRFVLIREATGRALPLSEEDYAIWELIDGESSVQSICARYLERHRRLAVTRVYSLLPQLLEKQFLTAPEGMRLGVSMRRPRPWWQRQRLAGWLAWRLPGTQSLVAMLAALVNRLKLERPPVQGAIGLVILTGLVLAANLPSASTFPLLRVTAVCPWAPDLWPPSYGYTCGLALLVLLHLVCSFLRELWRGAVEAAFTRRPESLELVMNYAMPAFRYPSTWRISLQRGSRFAAAAAGLEFEMAAAAVCALLLHWTLPAVILELIYTLMWVLCLRVLLNLSAFAGSDLVRFFREAANVFSFHLRALGFLRHGFVNALLGDAPMTREQKLYLAFNLIAGLWFALATKLGIDCLAANQQAIRDLAFQRGQEGWLLPVLLVLLLLPVLTTCAMALAWVGLVLWQLVMRQVDQLRLHLVTIVGCGVILFYPAVIVVLGKAHLVGPVGLRRLVAAAVILINLGALAAGGAMWRECRLSVVGRRYLYHSVAHLCGLGIMFGMVAGLRWSGGQRALLVVLLVVLLVQLAEALLWRLHLVFCLGARLALPELVANVGTVVLIGWAVTMHHQMPSGRAAIAAMIGFGLLLISAMTFAQAVVDEETAAILPMPTGGDPEATPEASLDHIMTQVTSGVARTVQAKTGPGALGVIRRALRRELPETGDPLGDGLAAFNGRLQERYDRAGLLFRRLREVLGRVFGAPAADHLLTRALDALDWQSQVFLHDHVLPATPWAQRFRDEKQVSAEQRDAVLASVTFLSSLPAEERRALISGLAVKRFAADERIVVGAGSDCACSVILEGRIQVEEQDETGMVRVLAILGSGHVFGEGALLESGPVSDALRTVTSCLTLALTRAAFASVADAHPELAQRIRTSVATRHAMLRVPLFADLPPSLLHSILPRIQIRTYSDGEAIVSKGEVGSEFFLISRGDVEALAVMGDVEEPICELGPGEHFGEIALLRDIPRTATVRARGEVEVLVLEKGDFLQLMASNRMFASNLELTGVERLEAVADQTAS